MLVEAYTPTELLTLAQFTEPLLFTVNVAVAALFVTVMGLAVLEALLIVSAVPLFHLSLSMESLRYHSYCQIYYYWGFTNTFEFGL